MTTLADIVTDLMQKRDELRLQLHLGSKEAEEEWENLTLEWDKFLSEAQFDKSKDEVGEAARELGLRMKEAYDRFMEAMD